ncbi:hypothetical protein ACFQVC_32965 [Streptomyces monticola]|uniref:DUF1049 domain-containing protein n=1 Tax=Streptomyces monticola TaxID=2666263 RepID=A0ABW2JSS8_9ACTN
MAQWLCGVVAIGALAMLGSVALLNGPESFVFFLKRGTLLPLIAIFAVAMTAWLVLIAAGARADRREVR